MKKIGLRILYVLTVALFAIWIFTFALPTFILFGPDAATWPMNLMFKLEDKLNNE